MLRENHPPHPTGQCISMDAPTAGRVHRVTGCTAGFTCNVTCSYSEPFIIFSGGLSYDSRRPSLTIMHGKAITVLEMDHPIVDFLTLCETPYANGTRGMSW